MCVVKIEPFFKILEKLYKNLSVLYIYMSELDVNNLLNALENESNASIMNLTSSKIKSMKNNILQKLQLDRETLKSFHKKLKGYRYCLDMADVQYGYYNRWIP